MTLTPEQAWERFDRAADVSDLYQLCREILAAWEAERKARPFELEVAAVVNRMMEYLGERGDMHIGEHNEVEINLALRACFREAFTQETFSRDRTRTCER